MTDRVQILRQAAQVFRERGFHGAGMREIAKALGMTPGALYYYFESKEDLLYQVQILALENLIATGRAIAGSALPPPEKIEKLIRAHLAQILGEMGGGLAHLEFHALPKERLAASQAPGGSSTPQVGEQLEQVRRWSRHESSKT